MANAQPAPRKIPSVRISPDNPTVLKNLGLLAELAGNWHGTGFNLVARPDFQDQTNVFLKLNLTSETTKFDPISSSIPNRGFAQPDIELSATSDPSLSPPAGGQQMPTRATIRESPFDRRCSIISDKFRSRTHFIR